MTREEAAEVLPTRGADSTCSGSELGVGRPSCASLHSPGKCHRRVTQCHGCYTTTSPKNSIAQRRIEHDVPWSVFPSFLRYFHLTLNGHLKADVAEIVTEGTDLGFLTRDEVGMIEMHPLIKTFLADKLLRVTRPFYGLTDS